MARGDKGMGDDRTPNLKNTKDGDKAMGRSTFKAWNGQMGIMDYPLDRSSVSGNAEDERSISMQGSATSLDHSIKGATAVQGGDRNNGGRKSSIKQS